MIHQILSHIDATGLNTFVTVAGIFITVASIWTTWYIGDRGRRTDRIHRVVAEFIRIRQTDGVKPSLEHFIAAGATVLSQSEMEAAGLLIRDAGFPDPMSDPNFHSKGLIAEAKRQGVDFGNFTSRVSFLISKLPRQNNEKLPDESFCDEGGTNKISDADEHLRACLVENQRNRPS